MAGGINNFRIKDWLWVQFGSQSCSFGWKGLPADVHFTLAFNDFSEDINLHVTRNISDKNKPKIEIVRVNKTLLTNVVGERIQSFPGVFLEAFDEKPYLNGEEIFLPYDSLQDEQHTKITNEFLSQAFKDLIRLKKNRAKVDGDVENAFKELATSDQFLQHFLRNVRPFPANIDGATCAGILISGQGHEVIFGFNSQWFKMKQEVDVQDLVKVFVDPHTVRNITYYFRRSIIRVKYAEKAVDTLPFNKPIILRRNEQFDLVKDVRWELIESGKDFESFKKNLLPEFFVKESVPTDVKEHLRIANKILVHSYFVYEFIDVAFTHVIIGLEKALKKKFNEVTGKDGESRSFGHLIDWAFKNKFFETDTTELLHAYRNMRNGKVHSSRNTLGGLVYLQKVAEPIMFINDLYEDASLRSQRKALQKAIIAILLKMFPKGQCILDINEQSLVVIELNILFVNNKSTNPIYNMGIALAFDTIPLLQGKHFMATVIDLEFGQFCVSADQAISFSLNQMHRFSLRKPSDLEQNFISSWEQNFQATGTDGLAVKATIPLQFNEFYKKALDRFYRHA